MVDLIVDSQLLDEQFKQVQGQVQLLGATCLLLLIELDIIFDAGDVRPEKKCDEDPAKEERRNAASDLQRHLRAMLATDA